MFVRICIYGIEVSFFQGCWDCEDDSLCFMLQVMVDFCVDMLEEEERYVLYVVGCYGGLIVVGEIWQMVLYFDFEILLEDMVFVVVFEKVGWFNFLCKWC